MKPPKWKPEMDRAWVEWRSIGFGLLIYLLWTPNSAGPLGFVWGCGRGNRFDVMGSYTVYYARRFGVRTRLNGEIFKTFSTITTEHGSKYGGLAFLKASGYVHSRKLELYYLTRKPCPKTRASKTSSATASWN